MPLINETVKAVNIFNSRGKSDTESTSSAPKATIPTATMINTTASITPLNTQKQSNISEDNDKNSGGSIIITKVELTKPEVIVVENPNTKHLTEAFVLHIQSIMFRLVMFGEWIFFPL
jgi:hypothetical protein